jgi:hypothetical protein
VYGCLAFILHRHPNKQVNKSERAIFLGLSRNNHNAFIMMSLETKCFSRFITARDVICHENILPFKKAIELPKLRAWIGFQTHRRARPAGGRNAARSWTVQQQQLAS